MATWTSLVVLSLAVVSTLSFPRSNAKYRIPTVGLGSRAQYYVLHSDGSYKFGYDSGDGIYEQSMAQAPGEVTGAFGYKDPTGEDIKLEYTADKRGFLPRGGHLPIAPKVDFGAKVKAVSDSPSAARSPATSYSAAVPAGPVEVAQVRSSANVDGSYNFGYETSSSSRSESGDAQNSVRGQFAFTADDGVNRGINYRAGAGIGFIAEGDSLPVGPAVPGAESGIPTGNISPVLSEAEANALAAHSSFGATRSNQNQPSSSAVIVKSAPTGSSDASYSFSYDADESSRSENADANLNVQGSYSFLPPEGHRLTVNYVAGSETGFVATGDHLPVAPEADSRTAAAGATAYSAPARTSPTRTAPASPGASAPVEIAQVRSSAGDDGSYNFGYETVSSSRSESADAGNSVRGSYSFVADDGVNRGITYIAGSNTGYIAKGDSLPVGPSVPGAESGIPTGEIYPVLSEEEANKLAAASSGTQSATVYAASSSSQSEAASSRSDASYSFNYDAGDSARQESADANLNVQGSYSFEPPAGGRLTVNYVAGSDTGFVATGDHLPVADETGAAPYSAAPASPAAPAAPAPASPSVGSRRGSKPSPAYSASVKSASADPADASYSFSYDAGDSARQESADANLNVQGSYSFEPPAGGRLTVNYVAGSDTGFVATGDHLPVADETGAVPYSAAPAAPAAPVPASPSVGSRRGSAPSPTYSASVKSASADPADASYSFSYDAGDSARQESADANLNIQGQYSFVPPQGHRLTVNYKAGSETGFVATGDHIPGSDSYSGAVASSRQSPAAAVVYSSPAFGTSAVSAPSEVARVRSSADPDGGYSFSYENSDSSRSESADSQNSVTGQFTFIADDGVNRKISYVAGSDTGYIADGDFLPVGPSVPGAESGIPTGRILPVLSEEEANALARGYSAGAPSPLLKTSAAGDAATGPADASYSFAFESDTYSRNEEADADGNIVGSYTYVDEFGEEHTVDFVAGRETGFLPEGYPTPNLDSPSASVPVASAGAGGSATAYSSASGTRGAAGGAATKSAPAASSQQTSFSDGHSSRVVGDVLLHQYGVENRDKYGYVFTAVRR